MKLLTPGAGYDEEAAAMPASKTNNINTHHALEDHAILFAIQLLLKRKEDFCQFFGETWRHKFKEHMLLYYADSSADDYIYVLVRDQLQHLNKQAGDLFIRQHTDCKQDEQYLTGFFTGSGLPTKAVSSKLLSSNGSHW